MVRWLRWHCPPDTGFEIRALAVWGRARYLSVTEAPHNTDFPTWIGRKHFFVSFKLTRPGTEPRALVWKAAVLTTSLGPPPFRAIRANYPSKHETFIQCRYNVGPPSATLARHCTNIGICLLTLKALHLKKSPTWGLSRLKWIQIIQTFVQTHISFSITVIWSGSHGNKTDQRLELPLAVYLRVKSNVASFPCPINIPCRDPQLQVSVNYL